MAQAFRMVTPSLQVERLGFDMTEACRLKILQHIKQKRAKIISAVYAEGVRDTHASAAK